MIQRMSSLTLLFERQKCDQQLPQNRSRSACTFMYSDQVHTVFCPTSDSYYDIPRMGRLKKMEDGLFYLKK